MTKIAIYFISLILILLLSTTDSFGQCSDAGVCQIGGLDDFDEENKFRFSLGYSNGYSGKDDDVSFNSFLINAQYKVLSESELSFQLPYNFQSGPGGNINGIGDLILSWTQTFYANDISALKASVGAKLATGDENKAPDLPQVYQPGLGSNDFIFAIDYNYSQAGFGLGYQLAGGRNDKEGVRLKRGDDLLLRALYNFSFNEISVIPQLLYIKRLAKSSVLDTSSAGENFIEVDGSDQAQLNLLVQILYPLNERLSLFAEGAVPFLKREVNVDGLTRAYTFYVGIKFIY